MPETPPISDSAAARLAGRLRGGEAARRALLAVATLAAAACGGDGRLLMKLELPLDRQLDPTLSCQRQAGTVVCDEDDRRLARFNLRIEQQESSTAEETVFSKGGELTVGQVPVDTPFNLRLSAQTAAGQILGLGVVDRVEVDGGEDTVVAVQFRKPIAYVGAASRLQALDAAAATSEAVPLPALGLQGQATAVATTPNGLLVVVATTGSLEVYRTTDHQLAFSIPLTQRPSCVHISPDSRYAFVCVAENLAAVDLAAESPTVTSRGVQAPPQGLAFTRSGGLAWVLINGFSPGQSCGAEPISAVAKIRYGAEIGAAIFEPFDSAQLGAHVADIAVDPRNGKLLAALPCKGEIAEVGPGGQLTTTFEVPEPYDIAAAADHILVVSHPPSATGGRALLFGVGGSTLTRTFELPSIRLQLSPDSSSPGVFEWISEPKTDLLVTDVEVSPDGQRALMLYRLSYYSDLSSSSCVYRTDITASGFALVDLADGSVLFNQWSGLTFADCYANCVEAYPGGPTLSDKSVCENTFRAELREAGVLSDEGDPGAAALLFGGG